MRYKPIHARGGEKTHARVFFDLFLAVRFVVKRYILQQNCLKGQN